MTHRRRLSIILPVLTAAMMTIAGGGAANAVPSTAENVVTTCVTNLVTYETDCVESTADGFDDAYYAATGQIIAKNAADGVRKSASRALAESDGYAPATVTYALGAFWIDANQSGYSHLWTTPYSDLCATHSYTVSDLRDYDWHFIGPILNDSVSSLENGSGCSTWLYTDINQSGTVWKSGFNQFYNLSWMNDLASSVRWTG